MNGVSRNPKPVTRTLVGFALAPPLLFALQALTGAWLLADMPAAPDEGGFAFVLLSTALMAFILVAMAARLCVTGLRRVAVIGLVSFGIPANNLLEAFFFQLAIPRALLLRMLLQTLAVAAPFALLLDRLLGSHRPPPPASARAKVTWPLIAASDLLFVVLYVGAGMLVLPFVERFYGSRVPQLGPLVLMQVVRGLVLTGIALALVRTLAVARARQPLALGLLFALLGGVVPLLNPNPYMPSAIRWAHMVEVGASYFAFGVLTTLILRGRKSAGSVSSTWA